MDKKRLHHLWTKLRLVRPLYVFIALVVSLSVSVYALRQNNLTMVRLRQNVYQADKNNGDVQTALKQLQNYVISHMNTNLSTGSGAVYPPIQLAYTYDRLEQAALNQSQLANTQIYTDAENYCQMLDSKDFYGYYRVPCVEQYIQSHNIINVPKVPTSLYEFDFISPSWSPDLAGWTLLISAFLALVFIFLVVSNRWAKKHLN